MVIAVMPYVPGKIWTATRYTYMATPFFAILIAVAAGYVHHHATRIYKPAAHVLAAAALAAVGGLYAWQTIHQTQPFMRDTQRWHLLTTGLRANYDSVPPGTTIYVIDDDGLWSNPFWQPTWMMSVGHALYGKDVGVRALPEKDLDRLQKTTDAPLYAIRLEDGNLVAVPSASVTSRSATP